MVRVFSNFSPVHLKKFLSSDSRTYSSKFVTLSYSTESTVLVNPRGKQMEIGREGALLESWITRRFIIFQTKIGGAYGVRAGVNNHSLPARFREKMQNLAGPLATLHRVAGLVIYRNSCGQPRSESSPVTFAENFHLVIGARVNATTVITITPRYPITPASFLFPPICFHSRFTLHRHVVPTLRSNGHTGPLFRPGVFTATLRSHRANR